MNKLRIFTCTWNLLISNTTKHISIVTTSKIAFDVLWLLKSPEREDQETMLNTPWEIFYKSNHKQKYHQQP